MATYRGAKARLMRRFGDVPFRAPKYHRIVDKRPNAPGMHGPKTRRGKKSEYGKRLEEKQKLRFRYNVLEKQMRRYVKRAFNKKGVSGHILFQILESRLDNFAYRLGFGTTIWAARQLVNHGHVLVNGKKVDIPSYEVRVGDVVSLKEKTRANTQVLEAINLTPLNLIPPYIEVDRENFSGKYTSAAKREEIPEKIDEQLIVEFYSKYV